MLGEWDELANFDEDAILNMETLVDNEFEQIKAQVEAEKLAKKEAKAAKKTQ